MADFEGKHPPSIMKLALDLERNNHGQMFEQKIELKARGLGQGMQTIVAASDHGRRREQTTFRQSGNLVFEVARDHVAHFAERVRNLRTNFVQFDTEYPGGHERSRLPIATDAEHAAQMP